MKAVQALLAAVCTLAVTGAQPNARSGEVKLGAYDPHGLLKDASDISIDHAFLYWQAFKPDEFRRLASDAAARGRELMVTVEPWTRAPDWKDGRETHLPAIIAGGFDGEIDSICREIGATGRPVMVSFGHEMDEQEGRFPWANHDPRLFQDAYRHFVDRCRRLAPAARFGWTPKGERTLRAYYPGAAHVDFIGLAVFDLQAWNRDQRDPRNLHDKFGAMHAQVAGFGQPIVVAEFGVEGDDGYVADQLSCARERFRRFPDVEAVVYFNDRETWRWPDPYGQPDWRIADSGAFRCELRREADGSRPRTGAAPGRQARSTP